jgi:hypothetical protein
MNEGVRPGPKNVQLGSKSYSNHPRMRPEHLRQVLPVRQPGIVACREPRTEEAFIISTSASKVQPTGLFVSRISTGLILQSPGRIRSNPVPTFRYPRGLLSRPSSLFLQLQPRVHVLLLKLLELDAVVDALQALIDGPLSARSRMLLKELSDIRTFLFGTKAP